MGYLFNGGELFYYGLLPVIYGRKLFLQCNFPGNVRSFFLNRESGALYRLLIIPEKLLKFNNRKSLEVKKKNTA